MFLVGKWDLENDQLIRGLFNSNSKIGSDLQRMNSEASQVALRVFGDLCAVTSALWLYCRQDDLPRSSQVAGLMLRSVIDACISTFAFCQDTTSRTRDYLNFTAVVDFRLSTAEESLVGSPMIMTTSQLAIAGRKRSAVEALATCGQNFLRPEIVAKAAKKGKSVQDLVREALMPGQEKPAWFRITWYPMKRREVLEQEQMAWIYDFFWPRLSSATHSDAAAATVFSNLQRNSVANIALSLWCAGVYRIADEFRIQLPANEKGAIRYCYNSLQWTHRNDR